MDFHNDSCIEYGESSFDIYKDAQALNIVTFWKFVASMVCVAL